MSNESTTTIPENLQIQFNKDVEKSKADNWRVFGIALYANELRLNAWAVEIISQIPAPTSVKDLQEFEKKFEQAKSDLIKLKEQRMKRTSVLDQVCSRLMQPEKSVEEYIEKIKPAIISLKKQYKQDQEKSKAKLDELSTVRESVLKHTADMESQLSKANLKLIDDAYAWALEKIPPEKLSDYLVKIKSRVTEQNQTVPTPAWTAKSAEQSDVDKIINETFKPRSAQAFIKEFTEKIDARFSDYENAYKNKEKAKQLAREDSDEEKSKIDKDVTQAHLAANFVSSSSSITSSGVAADRVKELKRVYKLQMDETQANSLLIMTAFVANLQPCLEHLRIAKWFNLSVKHMCAALEKVKTDDNNFSYTGLVFEETDKL